ncbi:MAG: histidinol-phosphatase [Shinella sp.]|nr:MAG: histidinol-phosphatase [Shinella sp.]
MRLPDIEFLNMLADAADRETMSRFRTALDAETKPKEGYSFDPVTEADRAAEKAIRDLIRKKFPEHAILGEEYGAEGDGNVQWVLDPIDGTRPFLCGLPVWGTLIGLSVDGRARIGMMSQPVTGERFWSDGEKSYLQRAGGASILRTGKTTDLSKAILHTNAPEQVERHRHVPFANLVSAVRMTRYGGECYAFAMLAAGQIDLCVEFNLQPYDIMALIPIIEAAGGVITGLDGQRVEQGGFVLASANSVLHEKALEILNAGRKRD